MRASRITPTVTAGQTYYIVVDGYGGAQGTFALTVTAPGSVTSTTTIATATTSTTRATTTTTLLCAPPPSPSGLSTTTMSCQEVDLRWTLSSGTVSGYNVYRKRTTDASYTMLTQLGATPAFPVRDTTASGSNTYSYGVTAVNQGGSSLMATALVNTPTCPVASGNLRWATRMGGASVDSGNAVAVRPNGNVIVAGAFFGTGVFGGTTLTSAGNTDVFVAEFTAAGAPVWARRYGGAGGDERVAGLAIAPDGSLALVGSFWGTANFGGGDLVSSSNSDDIFLVKLSATGDHVWSRRFGNFQNDGGTGVAVDGAGNVIMVGAFSNSVDFGGTTLTVNGTSTVVAKYAGTDGSLQWAHNYGVASGAANVVIDHNLTSCPGDNCIVFAGQFGGTINYGCGTLSTGGFAYASVVKLSPAGNCIWAKGFGGNNADYARAVAIDGNGDVLVTGDAGMGSMTIGTTTLTIPGSPNAFLFKVSGGNGSPLWARSASSNYGDSGYAVATDSANNVVFTGQFANAATLSGTTLTSVAASQDVFVAKYTSSGGLVWARGFGDIYDELGRGVAVDSNGNVAVTGSFRYSTNVLGTPLTSAGSLDAFLVSLTP